MPLSLSRIYIQSDCSSSGLAFFAPQPTLLTSFSLHSQDQQNYVKEMLL